MKESAEKRSVCKILPVITGISPPPRCKDKDWQVWIYGFEPLLPGVEANFSYCISGTYRKSVASSTQRHKVSTCSYSNSQSLSKSIEANQKLCNFHTASNRFQDANVVFPVPTGMVIFTQEPFSVSPSLCLRWTLVLSPGLCLLSSWCIS